MALAPLGFRVDTSQVKAGVVDLDALTQATDRVERAERGLAASSRQAETATGQYARQARDASTASAMLERQIDMVAAANGRSAAASTASAAALTHVAAASRMAANNQRLLMFQLNDITTMLLMGASPFQILASQGGQVVQIYQGQGGVRQALDDTVGAIGRAARAHPMLAAGALAAAVATAGLVYEINKVSDVSVSFGDVVLGVFQSVRDGISSIVAPAFNAIAPYAEKAWNAVVASTKWAGNAVINAFRAAAADVGFVWSNVPEIVGAAAVGAANVALEAIEKLLNSANSLLNGFIGQVNGLLPDDMQLGLLADIDLPQLENNFAARLSEANAAHAAEIQRILSSDPLGAAFGSIAANAQINARNRLSGEDEDTGGGRSAERQQEMMARRLEALRESLMTEEELERNSYATRMADMQEFYEAGMLSRAEYDAMSISAQQQHHDRMAEIAREAAEREIRYKEETWLAVGSALGSMSRLIETFGEKNLAASKAFAVGEVVVHTAVAVMSALRNYPGPLGWAQAAAVAAAGAAQVATILSAQKGGGSRAAVGSGASQQTAAAPEQAPAQTLNLTMRGLDPDALFTGLQVRELAQQLIDFQRDGGQLVLVDN